MAKSSKISPQFLINLRTWGWPASDFGTCPQRWSSADKCKPRWRLGKPREAEVGKDWLVVEPIPLKNMSQLGWWNSQLNGKIKFMFQTTKSVKSTIDSFWALGSEIQVHIKSINPITMVTMEILTMRIPVRNHGLITLARIWVYNLTLDSLSSGQIARPSASNCRPKG